MPKNNPNEFLTDLTIDTAVGKRRIKTIVLNETDKAIVHIPLKAMTRVDYNRLKEIYDKAELDLLTTLRDHKLDNGRNALVVYKNVIEVYNKPQAAPQPQVQETSTSEASQETAEPEKPARRKPGPKPKNKQPE